MNRKEFRLVHVAIWSAVRIGIEIGMWVLVTTELFNIVVNDIDVKKSAGCSRVFVVRGTQQCI